MALTSFTGTIAASTLRSNFDDATTTLASNASVGEKDQQIEFEVANLATGTNLSLRVLDFTPQDDLELRMLFMRWEHGGTAGINLTLGLTQTNAGAVYTLGETWQATATTTASASENRRVEFTDTTGNRLSLAKGVSYRLTVTSDSATAIDRIICLCYLRSRRREQ